MVPECRQWDPQYLATQGLATAAAAEVLAAVAVGQGITDLARRGLAEGVQIPRAMEARV